MVSPRIQKIFVRRQCELLSVNISRLYYQPVPEKPENVKMMETMDKHLTAIIDFYSRKIVGWSISNTMTAEWCKEMLERAIKIHGKPEIVNSDQGSQYTSAVWTQYLQTQEIKISMDGKGRALDHAWIERFWKSLKYDYVYLNPAKDGFELFEGVKNHIGYYDDKIHHTTRETPNQRYQKSMTNAA